MDIKEIALKVGLQVFEEHPYDKGHVVSPSDYTWIDDKLIEFAEALIESYKAELLNEVGEPAGYFQVEFYGGSPLHSQVGSQYKAEPGVFPLYTADDVTVAVNQFKDKLAAAQEEISGLLTQLREMTEYANKRNDQALDLQDQLAKAEQLWQIAKGRCDGLEEKLAASQAYAEQLREALNQWINIAANCSIQSGCCCCGDSMENHASPIACGHSPVDMADSVVHSAIQKTDNALALPRDTSALDAYVAEKVKEAMK